MNSAILRGMADEPDKSKEPRRKRPSKVHVDEAKPLTEEEFIARVLGSGARVPGNVKRLKNGKSFRFITSEAGEKVFETFSLVDESESRLGSSEVGPRDEFTLELKFPWSVALAAALVASSEIADSAEDEPTWSLITTQLQYLNNSLLDTRRILAHVLTPETK